jgi:tripartite-type tricarboxylate transporter receptor subunit TctC
VDVIARLLAQALSDSLGQPFVVENRTGASGRIGTDLVARAPADGYTLLLATSGPNEILPAVDPKLSYDAVNGFAPISLAAVSDYMLIVHPSMPVKSVADLIRLCRARPGEVRFASTGVLGTPHMAIEMLQHLAHIKVTHVPYRGGTPATTAVISGEVSALFASGLTAGAHVDSGRVRAIAVSGPKRSEYYPNLPTVAETVPGFDVTQWYGLMAPGGTPASIVALLNAEVGKALRLPGVSQQIRNQKADPVYTTPDKFAALIRDDIARWKAVAKSANIKPE